jgi:hypothetical protein
MLCRTDGARLMSALARQTHTLGPPSDHVNCCSWTTARAERFVENTRSSEEKDSQRSLQNGTGRNEGAAGESEKVDDSNWRTDL